MADVRLTPTISAEDSTVLVACESTELAFERALAVSPSSAVLPCASAAMSGHDAERNQESARNGNRPSDDSVTARATDAEDDLAHIHGSFNAPSPFVLVAGMLLAHCAGFVDAVTFLSLGGIFPTHVTGTVATVGMRLEGALVSERHTPLELRQPFFLVLSFLTGSFLCGLVISKNEVHFGASLYGAALMGNSVLIVLGIVLVDVCSKYLGDRLTFEMASYCVAAASGLQNGMCTMHFGAVVRTTHITGIVTDLGLTLGRVVAIVIKACFTKSGLNVLDRAEVDIDKKKMGVFVTLGFGFFSGVIAGSYIEHFLGWHALLIPAGITGSAGFAYMLLQRMMKQTFESTEMAKLKHDVKEVDRILERTRSYLRNGSGTIASPTDLDHQMSHALEVLHDVEATVPCIVRTSTSSVSF
eukprot:TRINITY_DN18432_c0_g1_i1.p1 TRINITY_DN18432_c0_g1~~TRINITY_DN18432_c0_g1_i1.p1  ORF type:complete len:444 (-),score=52.56 TRINITY_DN18432_c0_g1_i1:84-1325(-)